MADKFKSHVTAYIQQGKQTVHVTLYTPSVKVAFFPRVYFGVRTRRFQSVDRTGRQNVHLDNVNKAEVKEAFFSVISTVFFPFLE